MIGQVLALQKKIKKRKTDNIDRHTILAYHTHRLFHLESFAPQLQCKRVNWLVEL
jgi:hypothetical protein